MLKKATNIFTGRNSYDALYSPPQILRLGLPAPRFGGAGQAGRQFKGGTTLFQNPGKFRIPGIWLFPQRRISFSNPGGRPPPAPLYNTGENRDEESIAPQGHCFAARPFLLEHLPACRGGLCRHPVWNWRYPAAERVPDGPERAESGESWRAAGRAGQRAGAESGPGCTQPICIHETAKPALRSRSFIPAGQKKNIYIENKHILWKNRPIVSGEAGL